MTNGLLDIKKIYNADVFIDLIPKENTTSRPQTKMTPRFITIHNTGNSSTGADAEANSEYVDNATGYVSWHFTVDEKSIYQELPVFECAHHAGDGYNGEGNTTSIGIEICENADGDYFTAENNAIYLINHLMSVLNIPLSNVVPHQHWSGKYCPHIILDYGWENFMSKIEEARNEILKPWEQTMGEEAVDSLAEKNLINNPEQHKAKDLKNESVPLWLFFEMMDRITE